MLRSYLHIHPPRTSKVDGGTIIVVHDGDNHQDRLGWLESSAILHGNFNVPVAIHHTVVGERVLVVQSAKNLCEERGTT